MQTIRIEIKWAIIFTFMSLLWMLVERMTGLHDEHIDKHMIYTNFIAIPTIAIYVFALLDKRKNFYGGRMTYVQGLVTGLKITAFVALLSPLTQYLTATFISPDYFENAIQYSVSEGQMTREAAESYFSQSNYIVQGLFGALVMGILTSAIVAIFTKKKPRNSEQSAETL